MFQLIFVGTLIDQLLFCYHCLTFIHQLIQDPFGKYHSQKPYIEFSHKNEIPIIYPPSEHQHCTDEAQKAETVLSVVSYII